MLEERGLSARAAASGIKGPRALSAWGALCSDPEELLPRGKARACVHAQACVCTWICEHARVCAHVFICISVHDCAYACLI